MYKKINSLVQVYGVKNMVSLVLFSVLIVCLLSNPVNELTDYFLPKKEITITVENSADLRREVWICNVENTENYFSEISNGEQGGFWEYRDAESYHYICDVIITYGNNAGASITFSAPIKPSGYICFEKHPTSSVVSILVDGEEHCLDLYSEKAEREYFHPFPNSFASVFIKIAIYAVLFLSVLLLLIAVRRKVEGKKFEYSILLRRVKTRDMFLLWMALYIFAIVQYKIGIPNFLAFGDQRYYWTVPLFVDGVWNPHIATFRGYICELFPSISQTVGERFNIDPVHVYFIFTSAALAWLFCYVIPELYKFFSGNDAAISQVLSFAAIYLFFWNGTLTAVLVDMMAAVSFFSGILAALKFGRDEKIGQALQAGFWWAVACCYRLAYQYGIEVFLLLFIGNVVINKQKNLQELFRKRLWGILGAILVFCTVLLPQFQVNLEKGHVGLLPYDSDANGFALDDTLALDGSKSKSSLLAGSANGSLINGYAGYPMVVSDDQMLSMKTENGYEREELLTIPQILSVYANNPIDTLVYIAKKLMTAFDVKTSVSYPSTIDWRHTSGLIFSFLNYITIYSALYCFAKNKQISQKERLLFAAFVLGLVLPQMLVHVEWRYFLASYMLLYYFAAYYFLGELRTQWSENIINRKEYFAGLNIAIFVAFTISLTICA